MEKIKLIKLHKLGVSYDTLERVEGIINMDKDCFNDNLCPENVAKITRDAMIELVKELYENLPISHIEKLQDMEVIKQDYELNNED